MAGEVNNQSAAAGYTAACTARGTRAVRVRVIVRNAAIWLQYGYGGRGGTLDFDSEKARFLPPGTYSFDEAERPPDGARAKSFVVPVPTPAPSVTIDLVNTGL